MNTSKEGHPVQAIEVLSTVEMRRAHAAEEIVELFERMKSGEIPGFQIASEYFSSSDELSDLSPEERLSHAINLTGQEQKGDAKRISTVTGDEPLHTDKVVHENGTRIVDEGTTHRFHLNISEHNAKVQLGALQGHDPIYGSEYREGLAEEGAVMPEMHEGTITPGDMTIFNLDPNTAHRFITTSGDGNRKTVMANAGKVSQNNPQPNNS